jgi:hypothetical protein
MTNACKISIRKREGKTPLGKARSIWKDNIKKIFKKQHSNA